MLENELACFNEFQKMIKLFLKKLVKFFLKFLWKRFKVVQDVSEINFQTCLKIISGIFFVSKIK